jgi:hypothetical protein
MRSEVRDARKLAHPAQLDREGFAQLAHETRVRDFLDPAEVTNVYYAELESTLARGHRRREGRDSDHTLRSAAESRAKGVRDRCASCTTTTR